MARLDDDKKEFVQIPGHLPDPADKPAGCYFHPRCPYTAAECKRAMPLLTQNEHAGLTPEISEPEKSGPDWIDELLEKLPPHTPDPITRYASEHGITWGEAKKALEGRT